MEYPFRILVLHLNDDRRSPHMSHPKGCQVDALPVGLGSIPTNVSRWPGPIVARKPRRPRIWRGCPFDVPLMRACCGHLVKEFLVDLFNFVPAPYADAYVVVIHEVRQLITVDQDYLLGYGLHVLVRIVGKV